MNVSIIIITRNRFQSFLKLCLDSIEKYTDLSNKEIIIVSNGSTDETVPYVERRKKEGYPYKLIELSKSIRFSKAVNIGSLVADSEYLLVLRDDTYIMEKTKKDLWIDWLLLPFQRDYLVGLTGWFKFRDSFSKQEYFSTVCCMIKKSIFEQLNGLNENLGIPKNEIDFCTRLKKNGYKAKQVPEDFPIDEKTNSSYAYSPVSFGRINNIEFFDDYIIKSYSGTDKFVKGSTLDNELYCFKKFGLNGKNIYCPEVQKIDDKKYKIKRYKFSLGTAGEVNHENIRRMLFTISFQEFVKQTHEIGNILKLTEIKHRDIHPGNLLFSGEDRHLKLIDFCFATTDNLVVGTPPRPEFGDDLISLERVRKFVLEVFETMKQPIEHIKTIVSSFGRVPMAGSSPSLGMPYHEIDIPYFREATICKDVSKEFKDILTNISFKPKRILDVGCSVGYNSFNLMRNFFLEKVYVYEADPQVFAFLQECKKLFNLYELELNGSINHLTFIPRVDVIVCMNVHHWIYFELGKEKTEILMRNLISNCKEMFFQTSGAESGGHRVEEFKSKEDIQNYLSSVGAKEVTFINSSFAHGGVRHLFKVKGGL